MKTTEQMSEEEVKVVKANALAFVKANRQPDTMNDMINSCMGLVAFVSIIGFFIYLFTR